MFVGWRVAVGAGVFDGRIVEVGSGVLVGVGVMDGVRDGVRVLVGVYEGVLVNVGVDEGGLLGIRVGVNVAVLVG